MGRASFYHGDAASRVTNEAALGESHALATLYGSPDAAAVVCQTIAACAPASGYAVFAYGLSYGHYTEKGLEGRQWGADRASELEAYKHELAKTAITHRREVEAIYAGCFPRKLAELSDGEREDGAAEFRQAMAARFCSPDAEPSSVPSSGDS